MKPRNSNKKPYDSMHMPTSGQPKSTMKMPKKKAVDALSLCRWKKNQNVRSRPMMKARPEMNNRFPTASNPLSKSISTPKKRNEMPKPARPRPIFCVSDIDIMVNDDASRVPRFKCRYNYGLASRLRVLPA